MFIENRNVKPLHPQPLKHLANRKLTLQQGCQSKRQRGLYPKRRTPGAVYEQERQPQTTIPGRPAALPYTLGYCAAATFELASARRAAWLSQAQSGEVQSVPSKAQNLAFPRGRIHGGPRLLAGAVILGTRPMPRRPCLSGPLRRCTQGCGATAAGGPRENRSCTARVTAGP